MEEFGLSLNLRQLKKNWRIIVWRKLILWNWRNLYKFLALLLYCKVHIFQCVLFLYKYTVYELCFDSYSFSAMPPGKFTPKLISNISWIYCNKSSRHCTRAYTAIGDPARRPGIPQPWFWQLGSIWWKKRSPQPLSSLAVLSLHVIYCQIKMIYWPSSNNIYWL